MEMSKGVSLLRTAQSLLTGRTILLRMITESYGPIRIATNDAGLYTWLIRRPVRECVTWAKQLKLCNLGLGQFALY